MENKQKEKLRKLGLSEDQLEGVVRLIENQELFKLNEFGGTDWDEAKIRIPLKRTHPPGSKKFYGIDVEYVQEVYDEVSLEMAYELNNKKARTKIKDLMESKLPYYEIKCDEENNSPEVVDSGQVWIRVTDPETRNYIELVL